MYAEHFGTDLGNPYWYFFCPRNNGRPSRTTEAGYWKATGRERMIKDASEVIGKKRSLVFYTGRNPRGKRTRWIMHEYCATFNLPNQNAFVLCKLMKKPDDKGSTQTCNMGDSDIENQKGNNSSFGNGETSCPITSTTKENLPDDGIPRRYILNYQHILNHSSHGMIRITGLILHQNGLCRQSKESTIIAKTMCSLGLNLFSVLMVYN
ncbi:hypothetical protein GH714_020201 [Hevea brasiliensis]|uniref:NAC domain-containing protein n=1 Tax=Hevea brasiliensis TaxID=3981 RepID=A0A6A6LYX2_HEVBR|nr:hypothetical protein GH714_020201 [Hevea brasiliensis]